ncbi:MAG TPA: hypothetical protein VLF18_08635 [Tahibacter sp.]|uniref:hypothetical protein n=1 Tax=Tahibacter sp. TaxID=2056211 RepID=UPI002CB82DC3|nr:hypothetical protein [Tahibacter sp.]HSX60250.1 hypothetical protein [Tahibacter sp.]
MNHVSLIAKRCDVATIGRVLLLAAIAFLAGCVSSPWREREAKAYYEAQQKLALDRKPLFELKAQPGQAIMLTGVESLTVNDPREQRVESLPQQRSPIWDTINSIVRVGAQVYGAKVASDGVVSIVDHVTRNAGDHSVTTTTITGSYNEQGDTFTNSIRGDVSGTGAGIGNTYSSADTMTTVSGRGNVVGNDVGRDVITGNSNNNSGRQGSPGPIDNSGQCQGDGCQGEGTEAPPQP